MAAGAYAGEIHAMPQRTLQAMWAPAVINLSSPLPSSGWALNKIVLGFAGSLFNAKPQRRGLLKQILLGQ